MQNDDLKKILAFSHTLYGVKNILRFKGMPGWTIIPERWDSVAEHSYRRALLAVMLAPYLEKPVQLERVLKMILVHDIVELAAEDFSPISSHNGAGGHAFNMDAFKVKYEREAAAGKKLFAELPESLGKEFFSLWEEYAGTKAFPENATDEGRFAYALDKIEAAMQIVDWAPMINDWSHTTKSRTYTTTWSQYDETLAKFAKLVEDEMDEKAGRI